MVCPGKSSQETSFVNSSMVASWVAHSISSSRSSSLKRDFFAARSGITGEIKETSEATRHKIQEFFNTTLKMDPGEVKNINIAVCHRICGSRDATKESIIIRFVDLQQRDYILNLAKKLPK